MIKSVEMRHVGRTMQQKMVESNQQNERSKEKYHAERGRQTLAIETSKEMDA